MEELRHLQWFRMKVIHTVSGWFGSEFWAKIALPATSSEPAILHAIIALSAAHRCDFQVWQAPDARERFMLQQYSKAIHLLQSLLMHSDKATVTVVLIVCQIFTFLEHLRGRHSIAETHLRNGLKLLKDLYRCDSPSYLGVLVVKPHSHAKAVDKGIIRSFATLHVQADLFDRHMTDISMLLQPMEVDIPYPTFPNVEEAKDCLDKVLHGLLIISQRFQETRDRNGSDWAGLVSAQKQTRRILTAWLEVYLRTTTELENRLSDGQATKEPLAFGTHTLPTSRPVPREPLAYRLLLNYHAMATIICKCMQPTAELNSESKYEAHIAEFLTIIEGSVEIWKAYLLARAIPGNVKLSASISEFGYIPPLYYTALKCRNHRIRLHAIRLLSQIPLKESIWDSGIATNVGRKVMSLEEADLLQGMDLDDEFPLHEVPNVDPCSSLKLPDSSLFHEVQVELKDESASRVVLTCKRWRSDGELEAVQCRFDGKRWFDMP